MRVSQYLLATLKTIPKNCEIISHQLMLRAGLIRQVSSGLYIWLPTGLRVLKNIKNIIREEMDKIGAIELSMPIVQPAELWKKSGRWTEYGAELLRFKNRNNQDFILSPTHEEMISEFIHKEITSCNKDFSLNIYQITTKYRDEIRPCFGIIRAREFIMKDGYSFHIKIQSLQNMYNIMCKTYCTIFNKVKLNFSIVQADTGKIGGKLSHEFRAYPKHIKCNTSSITRIIDKKKFNIPQSTSTTTSIDESIAHQQKTMRLIQISNIHSITELIYKFNLSIKQIVKTIIVHTTSKYQDVSFSNKFLGLVIRADHQLNHKKIEMIPQIHTPLTFANTEEIHKLTGDTQPNLLGAINISIPLIIDYNVAIMKNFIAGSNINNKYFFGINWNKDFTLPKIADLYEIQSQHEITRDHIKETNKKLSVDKYIEIGHIFQLKQKYSNIIHYKKNDCANNKHINKNLILNMGCYGIGVTRIVAAIIEQHHDHNGIIWPAAIAPFKIAIIPINMYHSINVQKTTENIYNQLLSAIGNNILLYDQQERPGVMFANIDLIGIPHILIISDRNLINQKIEYKYRKTGIITKINIDILLQFLIEKLNNLP